MADPFIAEIRAFGFDYAPYDWAYCDGQLMAVQQNTSLFALLGSTFGGNGSTNFQLPNLQGATPVGFGSGPGLSPRDLGEDIGSASVSLDQASIPAHTHAIVAETITVAAQAQLTPVPQSFLTRNMGEQIYSDAAGSPAPMDARMIGPSGGSLPHANVQPYQVLNFCICLYGAWPPRP